MGFLGRFKKKPLTENRSGPGILLAMVAFDDRAEVSGEALVKALRERWGAEGTDQHVAEKGETKDGIASLEVGDQTLFIAPMPAPIPSGDFEPLLSELAESDQLRMRSHRFHFVVTIASFQKGKGAEDAESSLAYRLVKLGWTVASLCEMPGAAGVLVNMGEPRVFPPAEFVREMEEANESGEFPLHLWVRLIPRREADGSLTLVTRGMQRLGLMEMEIVGSRRPAEEILKSLINFATYQFTHGPVLRDGNTIGYSADHKVTIRHLPSVRAPGLNVCRVEL